MIVLGLNGWHDRTHDPAAVLCIDGVVTAFIEQERLSRRKHAVGELPHAAARAVVEQAGVQPGDIDAVAYGWDLAKFNGLRGRDVDLTDAAYVLTGMEALRRLPVHWTLHHDAHAASSFYGSGFDEAAVVVVDAEGEDESATIYSASAEGGLRRLRSWNRGTSLGLMYRAVSEFCGFGQFGAGKTMGLAPHATKPVEPLPLSWDGDGLRSPLPDETWEDDVIAGWMKLLEERFGRPAEPPLPGPAGFPPAAAHHPDAAAAAQHVINAAMAALVREAIALTGSRNVCLAGGVALNCVANGLLLDSVDQLHIPPYPHDAGVALGAAQLAGVNAGQRWRDLSRADLGSTYTDATILKAATSAGLPGEVVDDPAAVACRLLVDGQVIGWVQGRMEVGPRALGHRSILALPSDERTRDRVNRLKGRELWRPLAPSLLQEEVPAMFGRDMQSPYMLVSVPMTPQGLSAGPAAAHVDGTARLQSVHASDDPYRRLLEYVRDATGTGMLLNTSFNARGEPVVDSPAQAMTCARALGLDTLVIGNVVVPVGSPAGRGR